MRVLTAIAVMTAMVLIACSATMNFVFVSSLGKTPIEAYVLGAVSVAVDVMKALLAVFVAKALRDGQRAFAVIGGCAFLLFSLGSFLAAMGFTSVNRGAVTEERRSTAQMLSELERDLIDARKRRDGYGQYRPVPVVRELMGGLRYDPRWKASGECTAPNLSSQRELCGQAAVLKVELATAEDAARLDADIAGLRDRIGSLRKAGGAGAPDPQARFLAEILGMTEAGVQRLLMSMIALIVEVSSALGIYLATGHSLRIHPRQNEEQKKDDGTTENTKTDGETVLPPRSDIRTTRARGTVRARPNSHATDNKLE